MCFWALGFLGLLDSSSPFIQVPFCCVPLCLPFPFPFPLLMSLIQSFFPSPFDFLGFIQVRTNMPVPPQISLSYPISLPSSGRDSLWRRGILPYPTLDLDLSRDVRTSHECRGDLHPTRLFPPSRTYSRTSSEFESAVSDSHGHFGGTRLPSLGVFSHPLFAGLPRGVTVRSLDWDVL